MNIKKTALLLIDLQKEPSYQLIDLKKVIQNTSKLISEAKRLNIPVIYSRHINREDGVGLSYREPVDDKGSPVFYNSATDHIDIFEEIRPQKGDIVMDKYRWSAFYQTSLALILKSLGADHLIVGGLVTDGCVMNTVFDAYFRDYQVSLVKDICTTSNTGAHMSSILIMCNWVYGIEVFDTDELINKMTGKNYRSWKWARADQMQFSENSLKEVFESLNQPN